MSRPSRWLFGAVSVALSIAVALAVVEFTLRAMGRRPWSAQHDPRRPAVLVRDPVLGWRPRPGVWWFGPYGTEQRSVSALIWPDGSRATGPEPVVGKPEVLLIGCSLTMGWAVADDETWAWGLQSREPELRITNHGVVGYGTYHSLLMLEELLRRGDRPAAVLYGYFYGHDDRNAASPLNLLGIAMYSLQGMVATPYCTLDDSGGLVRHPPEAWPSWPLHDRLALVGVLERAYEELYAGERPQKAFDLTNRLILEMADLCRRYDIPFAMVELIAPAKPFHTARLEFLRAHGIPVIECDSVSAPELQGSNHMIPGDLHPDAAVHRFWARCVAEGLDRLGLVAGATAQQ